MNATADAAVAPLRLFERVRLVRIQPPGYVHGGAFAELVEGFQAAFVALGRHGGGGVDASVNQPLRGEGVNFVFGAHLIAPEHPLPANTIIVNLEQMRGGVHVSPHYVDLLGRHAVLDYSARNVERIRELTGNAHVHPFGIGYMPVLTRIEPAPVQDIDVLFYGLVNERRRKILDALTAAGLRVAALPPGVYGAQRDAAVARAKVVLNVHFYADKVHEIVRSSYLLANRKAVVSECEADTEIDADIRQAVVAVPYTELVDACVALVRDEARRRAVESEGHAIFARRDQAALLAEALPKFSLPLPGRINLGSGKAYDAEQLNIDVDAKWQPDVLGDLAAPTGLAQIFFSRRFGLVRLDADRFDEISVIDVLEHVPDLVAMMTRCLALLRPGGILRAVVPYDLSWGAWQDPTHVRAFNERSWLYYTDWHWYLGWNQARFDVREMGMKLSPVGEALRQRGVAGDELFRTPRAVDEMRVALVKRLLTDAERQQALTYQAGRRQT